MKLNDSFVFQLGSEWAPDSPYGMDSLEVAPDGRFVYENRCRGNARSRVGWLSEDALDELAQALADSGFPDVPEHAIPPGAGPFVIIRRAEGDEQKALLDEYAAPRFPGYGLLVRRIDAWTKWLRGEATGGGRPEGLRLERE